MHLSRERTWTLPICLFFIECLSYWFGTWLYSVPVTFWAKMFQISVVTKNQWALVGKIPMNLFPSPWHLFSQKRGSLILPDLAVTLTGMHGRWCHTGEIHAHVLQNPHVGNLMSSEMVGIGPLGESGRGWVFRQWLGHEGRALFKEV